MNNPFQDPLCRSGRTTRIIDDAIQTLFKEGYVKLKDHGPGNPATSMTIKFLLQRMDNEHARRPKKVTDVNRYQEDELSPLYVYWDTKAQVRIKKRNGTCQQ